jgi:hypothetical protein
MRGALLVSGLALLTVMSPAVAMIPQRPLSSASVVLQNGLSNATILIVRHAEKPSHATDLSPAGQMRAEVYAQYFRHFELDGRPVRIDALVAAEDSEKSSRPRLTLEPLSVETGMPINQPCPDRAVAVLLAWLKQRPADQTTLVSWHHTKIAKLLAALGGDPAEFLPNGEWPDDAFDWVVALRFDQEGHLMPGASRVIHEPARVDNVVWSVMSHPTISPLAPAQKPR